MCLMCLFRVGHYPIPCHAVSVSFSFSFSFSFYDSSGGSSILLTDKVMLRMIMRSDEWSIFDMS